MSYSWPKVKFINQKTWSITHLKLGEHDPAPQESKYSGGRNTKPLAIDQDFWFMFFFSPDYALLRGLSTIKTWWPGSSCCLLCWNTRLNSLMKHEHSWSNACVVITKRIEFVRLHCASKTRMTERVIDCWLVIGRCRSSWLVAWLTTRGTSKHSPLVDWRPKCRDAQ